MYRKSVTYLKDRALELGARDAKVIDAKSVKTAACRHGDDARPSMEACGIDVYATARGNGFAIETLDSPKCKGNYFGLVLLK
jgi:predicted metal-binding protein